MVRPTEVIYFYFILKQKLLPPQAQIHTITLELQTSDNNSSRQIVYNKIKGEEIKPRRRYRCRDVAGWSDHYYLWACRRARSTASDQSQVYEYAASIKEQ
jgi:hypothetical protein